MTSKFSPNRSSSLQREDVASTLLNQTLTAPELLAPAGSLRNMRYAFAYGADAVFNLKFETCRIGQNGQQGLGSVEVLAYGTAFIPASAAVTATSAPQL